MSKNQATVKINASSMQVLKTLQLLLENNYTMSELVTRLNKKEKEPIFNNSVVSKYINTCRFCGIEIPKIHNRYFVANLPFGLDISVKELDLIQNLHLTAKNILSKTPNKTFDRFITKLNAFTNKHIVRVEKKTINITYEIFEKAIKERRKVILMLRAKSTLECIPIKITTINDKVYFNVKYKDKYKSISAERITGLELLEKRFSNEEGLEQVVIYKLFGNLAYKYTPREHEHITHYELPDYIVIKNQGENKNELLQRLLRYDACCQIISPGHYREEMKNIIKNTLRNYGE